MNELRQALIDIGQYSREAYVDKKRGAEPAPDNVLKTIGVDIWPESGGLVEGPGRPVR